MPTYPITVGTTVTPVAPYNPRRTAISFHNLGNETVFVSNDQVSIQADGFPIPQGQGLDFLAGLGDEPELAWYAESAAGGDDLRVIVQNRGGRAFLEQPREE